MRTQLLGSAAALAFTAAMGGPLLAADLPTKPVYKAAPYRPPAVYNWSGFYIGAHLGYGSAKFDFSTGVDSGNRGGVIGGGQLGFNWQAGQVVWGVEGDVTGTDLRDGQPSPMAARVDLLASLRGRLGLAMDRVLFYGTGGVAYVHGRAEAQTLGTVLSQDLDSFRGVAGVGIELAATGNLTFRIEGLDYFGHKSFDIGGDVGNKIGDIWVVRAGGNYRFSP